MIHMRQLPARAGMALIRLYQLTLGLLLPPSCRFRPSCSHYGIEALRRHGLVAGLWLTITRIGRCHPWGGCGHDPVPDTFRWWPSRRHAHPNSTGPVHEQ